MISPFNASNEADRKVISAMALMSRTREWRIVKIYLEKEQKQIDVAARMAAPYNATRLGAAAHTIQTILDKVEHSIDMVGKKNVR